MTAAERARLAKAVSAQRLAARVVGDVVTASALAVFYNLRGERCPADKVPTGAQLLGWLVSGCTWDLRERALVCVERVRQVLTAAGVEAELDGDLLAAEPVRWIEQAHLLWVAAREHSSVVRHPVDPLVAAWQGIGYVTASWDQRPHANLPAPLVRTRRTVHVDPQIGLPFGSLPVVREPRFEVGYLPTLAPVPSRVLSLDLLNLFDAVSPRQQQGYVPISARVGWEVLVALDHSVRVGGPAILRCTLWDLYQMVYPGTRWKVGKGVALVRGVWKLDAARLSWRGDPAGGRYPLVECYRRPEVADRDEVVLFLSHLPFGSQQGPQVDRLLLRRLAARSAREHRIMLAAYCLWDVYGTVRGYLIQPTLPVVRRDAAGYVLRVNGQVATEHGRPTRRATHPAAVQTGGREPNPEIERLPWIAGDDLILLGYSDLGPRGAGRRDRRRRVLESVRSLYEAGHLEYEFRGSGARAQLRLLPAAEHLRAHAARWAARRRRRSPSSA